MTEEVLQGAATEAAPTEQIDTPVEAAPVEESTESALPVEEEKLIPQSQVTKIAAREKRQTEQRYQRALEQQQAQYQAQIAALQAKGGSESSTPDTAAIIAQEVQKITETQRLKDYWVNVGNQFEQKVTDALDSDPDFADAYHDLNVEKHPHFVEMAVNLDNTAAVVKEVATNPAKFATILNLLNSGSPGLAMREMRKISAAIKQNETAKNAPKAKEPLSQVKPSTVGTSDGKQSVSDFRKMFKG